MRHSRSLATAFLGAMALALTGCAGGPTMELPYADAAGEPAVRLVDEFDEFDEFMEEEGGGRRGGGRAAAPRRTRGPSTKEISTLWGVRGGGMIFQSGDIGDPDARGLVGTNLLVQFFKEAKWMAEFGLDIGVTADGMDAIVYVARADLLFRPVENVPSLYLVGGFGYAHEAWGDIDEQSGHIELGAGYVLPYLMQGIDLRAAYWNHMSSENVQATIVVTAGLMF